MMTSLKICDRTQEATLLFVYSINKTNVETVFKYCILILLEERKYKNMKC